MSDGIALVLAAAAVTYATRLAGLLLASRLENRMAEAGGGVSGAEGRRGGAWSVLDGVLGYVPVAAFAALVAPNLGLGTPEMLPRLLGAAAAAAVVLRVGHLWAGLVAGMAAYWAASALAASLAG